MTELGSEPDVQRLRDVAVGVAVETAELVQRLRGGPLGFRGTVDSKSTESDVVTEADRAAERFVRARLDQLRPGEPVLGEEEGGSAAGDGGRLRWVVDPIDGTVNYLYGWPLYAVSLAAQRDGRSVAGAVVEPASGRVFSAAAGHGAWLRVPGAEPVRLGTSGAQRLDIALVGTGFAYDAGRRARQAEVLAALATEVRDFRRGGSAALDLCAVAAGWLDAYYEKGLSPWDWAAGALVAVEAGATVLAPDTEPGPAAELGADMLVAAAPGIARQLRAALRAAGAGSS